MSSSQDSENHSHYNYTNGSSDSTDSSNSCSNRASKLIYRENRPIPPMNYSALNISGIIDDREDGGGTRPTKEREREKEDRGERESNKRLRIEKKRN